MPPNNSANDSTPVDIGDCIWVTISPDPKQRPRPFIVVSVQSDYVEAYYITKENFTNRFKGLWLKKETKKSNQLGLKLDSFIQVDKIVKLPKSLIESVSGKCYFLDELKMIAESNG